MKKKFGTTSGTRRYYEALQVVLRVTMRYYEKLKVFKVLRMFLEASYGVIPISNDILDGEDKSSFDNIFRL